MNRLFSPRSGHNCYKVFNETECNDMTMEMIEIAEASARAGAVNHGICANTTWNATRRRAADKFEPIDSIIAHCEKKTGLLMRKRPIFPRLRAA